MDRESFELHFIYVVYCEHYYQILRPIHKKKLFKFVNFSVVHFNCKLTLHGFNN